MVFGFSNLNLKLRLGSFENICCSTQGTVYLVNQKKEEEANTIYTVVNKIHNGKVQKEQQQQQQQRGTG